MKQQQKMPTIHAGAQHRMQTICSKEKVVNKFNFSIERILKIFEVIGEKDFPVQREISIKEEP